MSGLVVDLLAECALGYSIPSCPVAFVVAAVAWALWRRSLTARGRDIRQLYCVMLLRRRSWLPKADQQSWRPSVAHPKTCPALTTIPVKQVSIHDYEQQVGMQ